MNKEDLKLTVMWSLLGMFLAAMTVVIIAGLGYITYLMLLDMFNMKYAVLAGTCVSAFITGWWAPKIYKALKK